MIELLVVIAIIAILSVVVILTLNPAQLIMSSRDSNRVSDMATLTSALGLYLAEGGTGLGSSNVIYVSIPDPSATSTAGDQCQGLNLISLPSTYSYHCAASSTFRNVNGTGWIPVNWSTLPAGSPLGNLPVDPTNNSSSRLYYTYDTNGSQYEVTSVMESSKYQLGGSNDVISSDGGTLASVYEKGSAYGLEPLDYGDGSLVGFWPLTEGTGTIAYDFSGNNATGTWNGTPIGTNSTFYSAGKIGSYAGDFDGSDDYIDAGNSSNLSIVGNLTITAWIYQTTSTRNQIISRNASDEYDFLADVTCGGDVLAFYQGSPATEYCSPANTVPFNSWVFAVVTRIISGGTSNMTFYLNGALLSSGNISVAPVSSTNHVNIGQRTGGGNLFHGFIDDVRVYNRALTAAQIAAMYAGGK